MKSSRVLLSVLLVSMCTFALVVAVGCSPLSFLNPGSSSSSSTSSSSSSKSSTASSSSNAKSSSASSSSGTLTPDAAKAQGYQVFEGTVYVGSGQDIIKAQGANIDPAMAGGDKGTYAILLFDTPTDVTGESADGSGQRTRSSKVLGIAEYTDYGSFVSQYGDLDKCKSLNGQHVTVAAKAADIMFPSDVRLPINEPSASKVIFL